jgi:hypothetical protein
MTLDIGRGGSGRRRPLAKLVAAAFFCLAATGAISEQVPAAGISKEAAASAANKIRQIQESADSGRSFGSIRISQTELNSYIDYELPPLLPPGISKIRLQLQPGRTQGTAEVDFDRLKGSVRTQPNPWIAFFLRGVHTLGVDGALAGSNGVGQFHLETVTLDDITMPQMLVEYLIDHYLKPRYPTAAVDQPFTMGFSIDKLTVEAGSVLLAGRPVLAGNRRNRLSEKRLPARRLVPVLK